MGGVCEIYVGGVCEICVCVVCEICVCGVCEHVRNQTLNTRNFLHINIDVSFGL